MICDDDVPPKVVVPRSRAICCSLTPRLPWRRARLAALAAAQLTSLLCSTTPSLVTMARSWSATGREYCHWADCTVATSRIPAITILIRSGCFIEYASAAPSE